MYELSTAPFFFSTPDKDVAGSARKERLKKGPFLVAVSLLGGYCAILIL